MEALYLLIPLSVGVVFLAIWVFFRMADSGQFDDMLEYNRFRVTCLWLLYNIHSHRSSRQFSPAEFISRYCAAGSCDCGAGDKPYSF